MTKTQAEVQISVVREQLADNGRVPAVRQHSIHRSLLVATPSDDFYGRSTSDTRKANALRRSLD